MSQSAISTRRTERMAATASRLTTLSRRLTAERGLNGFTIEELCDEVGVSRRTFFNYFPSKEEAVVRVDQTHEAGRHPAAFLGPGSCGWPPVAADPIHPAGGHLPTPETCLAQHRHLIAAVA